MSVPITQIFPVFPGEMGVLYLVCLVICLIGFYRFVWFLSVGYGLAVTGMGAALVILYFRGLDYVSALLCLLLIIYGIRLGGFLLARELKNAAYRKTLAEATGEGGKAMPFFVKAVIWVAVGLMYVAQVSPVLYRLSNGAAPDAWGLAAVVIMALSLILESVADRQKSAAKAKAPDRVCDTGLYRLVRCPNYLGEVLFWTGVLISGVGALGNAGQWAVAIVGYLLIVYVMFSGAKRLELRQKKRYGDDPAFAAYVRSTPILLPFVPLYSLEKVGWIK